MQREVGDFDPHCPYSREQDFVSVYLGRDGLIPCFRLTETFPDGSKFIGDSFGNRTWIDSTKDRPCSTKCSCKTLNLNSIHDAFLFSVNKTPNTMMVSLNYTSLVSDVEDALAGTGCKPMITDHDWDGFVLLKYRHLLIQRLEKMQKRWSSGNHCDIGIHVRAEVLSLLFNGVLNEPQIYRSYGFLHLHDQGYLELDEWEWFYEYEQRKSSLTVQISQLGDEPKNSDITTSHDQWTKTGSPACCPWTELAEEVLSSSDTVSIADADSFDCLEVLSDGQGLPPEAYLSNNVYIIERFSDLHRPSIRGYENIELWDAIRNQDVPDVQKFLARDRLDERYLQSPVQYDGRLLLLAVKLNCARIIELLLRHGCDVNYQLDRETPLSCATICAPEPIVRLLLIHGADAPFATLLLNNQFERHPFITNKVNSLARLNSSVNQKTSQLRLKIVRLRNNFWNEHSLMIDARENAISNLTRSLTRKIYYMFEAIPNGDMETDGYLTGGLLSIPEDVRDAWTIGVATLRALCRGTSPKTALELLMFLALAKSMIPLLDDCESRDLEEEFFHDLARWYLLFSKSTRSGCTEGWKFLAVIKATWGVDIMELPSYPELSQDLFEKQVFRVQHLTLRLFTEASTAFSIASLNEFSLENVQHRWRTRTRPPTAPKPAPSCPQSIQGDKDPPLVDSGQSSMLIDSERTTIMPEKGSDYTGQLESSYDTPDSTLVLVLAGTIFAILLAFLILMRNSVHASTIRGLFAFSAINPTSQDSTARVCRHTNILKRTEKILKLFLGIGHSQEEYSPQSTVSPMSNHFEELARSSSSALIAYSSRSRC
ncbi:hypothetical protein F4777DRAFT_166655 [Nemania sp. FL0916]|nr:hypothetical protein F4777DRAFT_166655 [Nemania sp. FL0916]